MTVAALRRLSTNRVDRYEGGAYARAFAGERGLSFASVTQRDATTLELAIDGPARDRARVERLVRRILGIDRDAHAFAERAARVPWLHELALRMQGLRAPRYPTMWEGAVNAIVFQQVSIHAAAAILGRTIEAVGPSARRGEHVLHAFPGPADFTRASDEVLRAAGLSLMKVATLRRVAAALLDGTLDESAIEALPSAAAILEMTKIKGVGPWTATVVLLRGLARLDVFPPNDSGVARAVRELGGEQASATLPQTLETLGDLRGLLYYHLLLARLEARGEL